MILFADRRVGLRWRRSTVCFCLLCAVGMTLVNIRGYPIEWGQIRPRHDEDPKIACAHGWPCVYLENNVKDWWIWDSEEPPISRWDLTSAVHRRRLGGLAVDIFAALGVVAAAGAAFEWRRRRRYRLLQFSLAEIMLLTLVCAVGLGWYARERARDARRRAALNALGEMAQYSFTLDGSDREFVGPQAVGPAKFRALKELLDADSQPVLTVARPLSDAELDRLKQLTDLHRLEFLHADDAKIACLAQTPNLRSLRFDHNLDFLALLSEQPLRERRQRLTPARLALLGGLKKLQQLEIVSTDLGDAGMAHLAALNRLETLDLSLSNRMIVQKLGSDPSEWFEHYHTKNGANDSIKPQKRVTDAGLSHLKSLDRLRVLRLPGTHLSDAGLEHLANLKRLEELDLRHTNLSGAGLAHLRGLHSLKGLDLSGSKINDAGMQHFPKFRRLEALSLDGTDVTEKTLPRLNGQPSLARLYLGARQLRSLSALDIDSLPALEYLDVRGAKISASEIDALRRRWPRLEIVDSYPDFRK